MSRTGYRVDLPSGRVVELVEPTAGEMLTASRAAGSSTGMAGTLRVSQAVAKVCLRKIDDAPTSITSLLQWPLSAPDTMALLGAIQQVVAPTSGATDSARSAAVVAVDGKITTWTVTIPGGPVVILRELPWSGLAETMAAPDAEPQMPLAGEYRLTLDGLKRSIVTIDGTAPTWSAQWIDEWPLSVPHTAILGAIWGDMHGLGVAQTRPTLVPTEA